MSASTGNGTHTWIDTDAGFADLVAELATVEAYGLDTEFHRERTYHARLALLQLSWPGGLAVVDPTLVDVAHPTLRALWRAHLDGRADSGFRLWALLTLLLWESHVLRPAREQWAVSPAIGTTA